MPCRDVGVAGEGELTEAPPLTPFAQMPADRSGNAVHAANLRYPLSKSNYPSGNRFLTSGVIASSRAIGQISGAGIASDAVKMEPTMSDPTELIDRYIAMWNETDPDRRRTLI